jgi:hypothetical protein
VTLNFGAKLTLATSSTTTLNFESTGNLDQIKVSGTLALASSDKLTLVLMAAPTPATAYDFLFASLGNTGNTYTSDFVISSASQLTYNGILYTPTVGWDGAAYDVTFAATAVPEPSTYGALAGGMALLIFSRRLRRGSIPR